MGQVTGIDTVFYQVCNMDRAVAFYTQTLGLTLERREGNDWAELRAGEPPAECRECASPRPINLALSGELAVAPQRGGATVVLRAEGLRDIADRLKSAGVVVGSVDDLGGALMLDVYDPDGNQVVLMEPVTD